MNLRNKITGISIIFLSVFLLISCRSKPTTVITEKDNNSMINVNKGQTFTVRLKARLSTGYGWKLVSVNKGIEMLEDPVQFSKEKLKTGGIDFQEFKFKPVSKGDSKLIFHYFQVWEKNKKPEKIFNVTINVK